MNQEAESLKFTNNAALFEKPRMPADELRNFIKEMANLMASNLADTELEQIAREIEYKNGISAGLGAVVDGEDFESWLDDAKSSIEPFTGKGTSNC